MNNDDLAEELGNCILSRFSKFNIYCESLLTL